MRQAHAATMMLRPPFWRWLFWACVVGVLVLSLVPTMPELPSSGWDKSNHFIGFITLAALGLPAYPARHGRLFVGLLLLGGLVEALQSLTPYRLADWADWLADAIGIIAAYGLYWLGQAIARAFAAKRVPDGRR